MAITQTVAVETLARLTATESPEAALGQLDRERRALGGFTSAPSQTEELWWIDTFKIREGHYYRYALAGRNGMNNFVDFSWSVPALAEKPYAFALREVNS